MLVRDDETTLNRTPLYDLHVALGGKMVPFAGYEMPVQYAPGVLREHLHTRNCAGLFDVSHMGQIVLRAKSGKVEDAAAALERLVPQDILALAAGRQRYAQFTNDAGGLLDDLMVANFGDHLFLVVNAACKAADEAHLRAQLSDSCVIEPLANRALIALQGPGAEFGPDQTLCSGAVDALHGCRSASGRGVRLFRLSLRLYRRGWLRTVGAGGPGRGPCQAAPR